MVHRILRSAVYEEFVGNWGLTGYLNRSSHEHPSVSHSYWEVLRLRRRAEGVEIDNSHTRNAEINSDDSGAKQVIADYPAWPLARTVGIPDARESQIDLHQSKIADLQRLVADNVDRNSAGADS